MNIAEMVIEPAYRCGTELTMLLRSLCDTPCQLAVCGVHFASVSTHAGTGQLILLFQRSRMTPVRRIDNKGGAYFQQERSQITSLLRMPEDKRLTRALSS